MLKECIKRHPVLSTVIRDSATEKPQLGRAIRMNLEKHLNFIDLPDQPRDASQRLKECLERIHNEPLAEFEQVPQWRAWIISSDASRSKEARNEFQVAFACSHALLDGGSGYTFHRTFLQALCNANALEEDEDPTFEVPASTGVLPALDRAAVLPISWSFLLAPLLGEYLPSFLASALGVKDAAGKDAWRGALKRPDLPAPKKLLSTAVHVLSVPGTTVQRVLKTCREHKARITGLLNHIVARALAQTLAKHGQHHNTFVVQTAMDLKKLIPGADGQMANYVSAMEERLGVPSTTDNAELDWEAVRKSTDLLAQKSITLANQPIALLKYLSNIRAWVLKKAQQPAEAAFEMSNLGVFDGGAATTSGWTVTDMVFSQSADATSGAPVNVNVASIKDGALNITVTWWPGMLGVDDEQGFVVGVCASIEDQLERIE